MYNCFVCKAMVFPQDVKYHTADKTKVFCGAECSVKYFSQLKENNNGKDEV
tara:strand:+ start:77 stop:229 length:153 start_codon:yes stop_codon:yes gene_type:complete